MSLAYGKLATIAVLLFVISSSSAASSTLLGSKAKAKREFMAAMKVAAKEYGLKIERNNRRKRFQEDLLSKAVPVTPMLKGSKGIGKRRVEDGAGYYDDDVDENENEEEEEEDDYYEPVWAEFGFDVSEFSLKYSSCASISFFNGGEEGGEQQDQDSVFSTKTFVTFRLCPRTYCQDKSWYGCKGNYGEYMVTLEDYLEAYSRYNEEVFEQFCDYCEQCFWVQQWIENNNRRLDEDVAAGDDVADGYYEDAAGDDVADGDDGGAEEENYYNNEQVIYCKYYDACESSSGVCEFAQQRWKKVTIMLMILFNLYTCCCTYITSSKSVKNHIFVSNSVL